MLIKQWKKYLPVMVVAGVIAGGGIAGAAPESKVAKMPSVSVLTIVEHAALDRVRDGLRDELKANGYEQGKSLRWVFQSAQGNISTAAQIARQFVGNKPDVIVAIATPSAQAVAAATKTVPLVYTAVSDPVAAQLVASWNASKTNVTGVSDALPLDKQMALLKRIVPNAKRIGMVFNPGEANSAVVVAALKKLLPQMGMTLVEAPAPLTTNIAAASQSLVGKVDVIYTNTDNTLGSGYEALVKVANSAKIPLIAADVGFVERGAIATLGMSYYDMGRQTGKMVVRVLKGAKPGDMASELGEKEVLVINLGAAKKQGVTLPADLIAQAQRVIP